MGRGPDHSPGPSRPEEHREPAAAPAGCWRVLLHDRALPLPTLRALTIGADPRNGLQLTHGSILPFHAQLSKRPDGFLLESLAEGAAIEVNGKPVGRALLRGGEQLTIGALKLRIEYGEVAAKVTATAGPPPSLDQEFYALLRRELARAPWVAISVAVHLALLMMARSLLEEEVKQRRAFTLTAEFTQPLESMDDDRNRPEDATIEAPDEPFELPEAEVDEPIEDSLDDMLQDNPVESVGVGDISKLGVGMGAIRETGFGGVGLKLAGIDAGLKNRLQQYRDEGVDLVFLVDTTASMEPFLSAAKRTCDHIITDLSALIPNLRLGVVAYRDEGDAYVTRMTPISNDRYSILNFLESLEARGGGDVPEAVLDAVEVALDDMRWRDGANRILLVVADAPPHPEDMAKLRLRLRTAARSSKGHTTVSTVQTGDGATSAQAEKALREIADYGGGEYSRLEDMGRITSHIIALTLGSQYRAGLEDLLARKRASSRAALVERKVKERNIAWLMKKLHIHPIEPAVVEGLIQIGSPAVGIRCLDLVQSPRSQIFAREAALYILRRVTRYRGDLDLGKSLTVQEGEVRKLQEALERTYRSSAINER